ncbi:MAG: hypothetical protein M0R51_11210 [Clostridia bacterium]|jgi:hypothetical protein|nr:hypothetical protein [Clostridia bacterium]
MRKAYDQNYEVKFAQGVHPNLEQLKELANDILHEPDMGWNWCDEINGAKDIMIITESGEEGTYTYRVNLSWQMITILKIE